MKPSYTHCRAFWHGLQSHRIIVLKVHVLGTEGAWEPRKLFLPSLQFATWKSDIPLYKVVKTDELWDFLAPNTMTSLLLPDWHFPIVALTNILMPLQM